MTQDPAPESYHLSNHPPQDKEEGHSSKKLVRQGENTENSVEKQSELQ